MTPAASGRWVTQGDIVRCEGVELICCDSPGVGSLDDAMVRDSALAADVARRLNAYDGAVAALEGAATDLWYAAQMLEAIYENDPSLDRKKAKDRAYAGVQRIRAALKEAGR